MKKFTKETSKKELWHVEKVVGECHSPLAPLEWSRPFDYSPTGTYKTMRTLLQSHIDRLVTRYKTTQEPQKCVALRWVVVILSSWIGRKDHGHNYAIVYTAKLNKICDMDGLSLCVKELVQNVRGIMRTQLWGEIAIAEGMSNGMFQRGRIAEGIHYKKEVNFLKHIVFKI